MQQSSVEIERNPNKKLVIRTHRHKPLFNRGLENDLPVN